MGEHLDNGVFYWPMPDADGFIRIPTAAASTTTSSSYTITAGTGTSATKTYGQIEDWWNILKDGIVKGYTGKENNEYDSVIYRPADNNSEIEDDDIDKILRAQ